MRWLATAGLLALAFGLVPLTPSQAHTLSDAGIPCLHHIKALTTAPQEALLTSAEDQRPCDRLHCNHGPLCCLNSCLAFIQLALTGPVSLAAASPGLASYSVYLPSCPDGFAWRPPLPPPRMRA